MARWSSIGRVHAALVLALFASTGVLFALGLPPGWPYLALWIPGAVLITAAPVALRMRKGPLAPVEVQLSQVWFAFALTLVATGLCQLAVGGAVLHLVPVAFAEAGLAIACMSVILRGSFWPLAVACGVCAVGSAVGPPWAMVPLGSTLAGLHFWIALRARRLDAALQTEASGG